MESQILFFACVLGLGRLGLGMVKINLLPMFCLVSGSIFTIVPKTQYVYVNDNVTFECATNLTENNNLYFLSRGAEPYLESTVTLPNGVRFISISLTATKVANGTNVTCYTLFNGHSTETVYLYIQG